MGKFNFKSIIYLSWVGAVIASVAPVHASTSIDAAYRQAYFESKTAGSKSMKSSETIRSALAAKDQEVRASMNQRDREVTGLRKKEVKSNPKRSSKNAKATDPTSGKDRAPAATERPVIGKSETPSYQAPATEFTIDPETVPNEIVFAPATKPSTK